MQKRPIVFVHGAWHGAWCWDGWLDIFKREGYTDTIAVELRGHGYKGGSFKHASLTDYVDDVRTIISELDTEPILIGHSLGCTIIQYLCAERHFPAAVLAAPIPELRVFKRVMLRQLAVHPFILLRSLISGTMKPWVTSRISPRLFFSSKLPLEKAKAYTNRMQDESFRLFAVDLLKAVPPPQPGTPMLLLAAEHDRFFSLADQQATARHLQAELYVAKDAGHDIMLDIGSVVTAEEVVTWLQTMTPRPSPE